MQQVLADFGDHPLVGDVRGVGLIDRDGDDGRQGDSHAVRSVAEASARIADRHARGHGLITRFIGDRIAFSPPLIITEEEVDDMAACLQRTLDDTWAEVRASRNQTQRETENVR